MADGQKKQDHGKQEERKGCRTVVVMNRRSVRSFNDRQAYNSAYYATVPEWKL